MEAIAEIESAMKTEETETRENSKNIPHRAFAVFPTMKSPSANVSNPPATTKATAKPAMATPLPTNATTP